MRHLMTCQRGAVAVLFGLLLIPIIGAIGFAVDTYRAYAVNQHLQRALDAAALAGAKNIGVANADPVDIAQSVFNANWNDGYMRSTAFNLNVSYDEEEGKLAISAEAQLPNIFMQVLGADTHINFVKEAEAQRKVNSLELALAIDNTQSLLFGAGAQENMIPSDPDKRRLAMVKSAAKLMLDILYDGENTVDNMWLSVVPFTSMVNVGEGNTNFLVSGSLNGLTWAPSTVSTGGFPSAWNDFFRANNKWRGCVYERTAGPGTFSYTGRDVTDDPPSVQAFYPYNVPPKVYYRMAVCDYYRAASDPWVGTCVDIVKDGVVTCPKCRCSNSGAIYGSAAACDAGCKGGAGSEYYPPAKPTNCRQVSANSYSSRSTDSTCKAGTDATCPASVYSTYCSMLNDGANGLTYGEPCPSAAAIRNGKCQPNYGPSLRCFNWESAAPNTDSNINRYRWHDKDDQPADYYPTPDALWTVWPFKPYPDGMIRMRDPNNYTPAPTTDTGFYSYPTSYIFSRTGSGGFKIRVMNDEVSACGNAAGVKYYSCGVAWGNINSVTGTVHHTARWIAAWPNPKSSPSNNVYDNVKLGGWGNSGCGLPVLPLTQERDTVEAAIDKMDVPLDTGTNFDTSTNPIPNTYPARAYQGTLLNEGLVWAWRSVSHRWQGLWSGGDADLPIDLTQDGASGTKAVVLLSDGLSFLKRRNDASGGSYESSVLIDNGTDNTFNMPDGDYDSSAYGHMGESWQTSAQWLRSNGNGAAILRTEATTMENNPPYYRELDRRFKQICSNMRAQNIQIYIVVFAMSSHPLKDFTEATFRECIGAPPGINVGSHGRYYDAVTEEQLRTAFKDIAANLLKLRLTK